MASAWEQINSGVEVIILPPPERKMIDKTHFIEVSYKQEADGTIVRMCRKGEITKKQKKISKAARQRQANFVKFGSVADKARGECEKGITETRLEEFGILWEGVNKDVHKNKMKQMNKQAINANKTNTDTQTRIPGAGIESDSKIQQDAIRNQRRPMPGVNDSEGATAAPKRTGYVAPGLRAGHQSSSYEDEEVFEIRISNLPDTTNQDDIRDMLYQFFEKEYHTKTHNEKRKMISPPSQRVKVYVFTSRAEKDVNAIVDVKSKFWQDKCIEELDGQYYGYSVIKVEKSKPRRKKF